MLVRAFLIIFVPPFMVGLFLYELGRQTKDAVWFAWNDCATSMISVRRAWKTKSLNPENWQ